MQALSIQLRIAKDNETQLTKRIEKIEEENRQLHVRAFAGF